MSGHRPKWLQTADRVLIFPALCSPALVHGVFDRSGGVSPSPWNSRNVSFGLGDALDNVRTNREQIKRSLGVKHLLSAKQVHGQQVCIIDENPGEDLEMAGFDALVTNVPGLGLLVQQADCQAVLLFDPEKKVAGIAHAGWRGTVADIIAETVFAMGEAFTSSPADIIAAVSPSLGPCCAEFVNFRSELPGSLHGYQVRPHYFDFWAISRDQLTAAGVKQENIHIAEICTCCNQDYFSYRRDRETGRFGSVIGMRLAGG